MIALAWIELHNSIWIHPKLKALSDALHIDRMLAGAHLIRLWTWAIENLEDECGDLSALDYEDIAAACGWRKSAKKLVEALIASHWLDQSDNRLFIHDWSEYSGGRLSRKRKSDRERKRKERSGQKSHGNSHDCPEDVTRDIDAKLHGSPADVAAHTVTVTVTDNVSHETSCPGKIPDAPEPKSRQPCFDRESAPYKLAFELSRMIHDNNPAAKTQEERDLQRWAKTFDLMIRRDKREPKDIWTLMEFSQQDTFWKTNILSPDALRKQFDRLTLKMRGAA